MLSDVRAFDGVIEFNAVLRDPNDPARLSCGRHLPQSIASAIAL
jgi:hypothetical protein